MSIYQTNKDCARIVYLSGVVDINTIDFTFTNDGFDLLTHEWSYSLDQSSWSNYVDKDSLLTAIAGVQFDGTTIYVRLKLEIRSSSQTQNFISYSLDEILVNGELAGIDHMELTNLDPILVTNTHKNLFNPYRQSDDQKKLYDQMSKSINDIFGFECIYFRTEAVESSKDITFKSYNLHQVAEYKDLKVSIADNEIPTDRLLFAALDIDFQDELEIHIVKEVFASVFGPDFEPNSNDFLYLPLTDRMYQLNTKQNGDLFFNHSPYWRAFLVKYEDRANVQKSDEQFERIEELIDFEQDYLAPEAKLEQDNVVKLYNTPKSDSRQNYISGDKLSTLLNGEIISWMYNYNRLEPTDVGYAYNLSGLVTDQWATIAWYKISEYTGVIQQVTDIDNTPTAILKIDVDDIVLVLDNGTISVTLNPTQLAPELTIVEDEYIGIVVNYSNTDNLKMSTISIFNQKVELVAEYAENNPPVIPVPNELQMMGSTGYANMRVANTFIAKGDMSKKLIETLPEISEYVLIDNAMPDLEEPKL